MKGFKVLLSIVVVLTLVAGISFAADMGHTATIEHPIVCRSGNQDYVSVAKTAGLVGTALSANTARQDGYILNVSTNYLKCSLTGSTTTLIEADYFILYPAGDSYNRDRMDLKRGNVLYQGPVYFYGQSAVTGGTKEVGSVSIWEWK